MSNQTNLCVTLVVLKRESFRIDSDCCICPCRSINGRTFAEGGVPGPVTEKLMNLYVDLVGFDWVSQYTRYPVKDVPRM